MNLLHKAITEKRFIEGLIPQKDPFVMVDKLFHFSEKKVVSGFTIPPANLFVDQGYFVGAGIIENMAQSVALHTGYQYYLKNESPPTGYIGAIKSANIFKLPRSGHELMTTVTILHEILGVTLVAVQVTYNSLVIANSEMKTVLAN